MTYTRSIETHSHQRSEECFVGGMNGLFGGDLGSLVNRLSPTMKDPIGRSQGKKIPPKFVTKLEVKKKAGLGSKHATNDLRPCFPNGSRAFLLATMSSLARVQENFKNEELTKTKERPMAFQNSKF